MRYPLVYYIARTIAQVVTKQGTDDADYKKDASKTQADEDPDIFIT